MGQGVARRNGGQKVSPLASRKSIEIKMELGCCRFGFWADLNRARFPEHFVNAPPAKLNRRLDQSARGQA